MGNKPVGESVSVLLDSLIVLVLFSLGYGVFLAVAYLLTVIINHGTRNDRAKNNENRHAGRISAMQNESWQLYNMGMPVSVDDIPAHNKRWLKHRERWNEL